MMWDGIKEGEGKYNDSNIYKKNKEMIEDDRRFTQQKYGHYCNHARSQGFDPVTYTEFKSARKYFEGGIKKLTNVIHGGIKNENN
jgi:hypothetical protein